MGEEDTEANSRWQPMMTYAAQYDPAYRMCSVGPWPS
jgi:hypothetical protein